MGVDKVKNEPAFPFFNDENLYPGITKREYFAATCPITYELYCKMVVQAGIEVETLLETLTGYANLRYKYADAMLAESEKSDSVN